MKEIIKEQKLVAITLLFACLFNYPLLSIFNKESFVWGVPILYVYVFSIWLLMIGCVAFITEKKINKKVDEANDE